MWTVGHSYGEEGQDADAYGHIYRTMSLQAPGPDSTNAAGAPDAALVADLKANFNPNGHLNETNPDANLYLRVDKTDLIVNSVEFTFLPTGVFQIESLGRVLKAEPKTPSRT
ncbi:MAG: hypothetical protein HY716_12745 [Planctomycetes bacterium]|nr:hypothetical protein [Planctomycetota bacterium]